MAPSNRLVGQAALGALAISVTVVLFLPAFDLDLRPGSPVGQSVGIIAAVLLVGSLGYVLVRRSDARETSKPRAQLLHAVVGSVGVGLAIVHSHAYLREWSALVFLAALGLLATGLYGRILSPQRVGRAFGREAVPFGFAADARPDPRLGAILKEKQKLAGILSGGRTPEGQFVLRVEHWRTRPSQAWRYQRLAATERALLARHPRSARALVPAPERWWRRLHLVFALLFGLGIVAHVVTTVFFAGYVADGREVYWWHLTAW